MTTDTSEKGLERLICTALAGASCDPTESAQRVIAEELPTKVAGDRAYQNAMANSDRQNVVKVAATGVRPPEPWYAYPA